MNIKSPQTLKISQPESRARHLPSPLTKQLQPSLFSAFRTWMAVHTDRHKSTLISFGSLTRAKSFSVCWHWIFSYFPLVFEMNIRRESGTSEREISGKVREEKIERETFPEVRKRARKIRKQFFSVYARSFRHFHCCEYSHEWKRSNFAWEGHQHSTLAANGGEKRRL